MPHALENRLHTGTFKISRVTVGATGMIILPYDMKRCDVSICNTSGSKMQIAYGNTCILDNTYTAEIAAGQVWHMGLPAFYGVISAVKPSGTGVLVITETFINPVVNY